MFVYSKLQKVITDGEIAYPFYVSAYATNYLNALCELLLSETQWRSHVLYETTVKHHASLQLL